MALLHLTRDNASPQGKSKVYLCHHPDDRTLAHELAKEILLKINCAVYYADGPITDGAAHLDDLADVNLFLVPVTERFLTAPSVARDAELPFAMTRAIPILPLMQESGLDGMFDRVFGNLQYLDPNATDATAISYDEKLEKYLYATLVGDELAQEIRSAFDAYVFLSYRKKDRAHAKTLMQLIHGIDFCRDVAIWYDEYLTPGENFNQNIKTALLDSSLVALAVTPNLINETNYVMTVEYPMAREAHKPILPVMLVSTDSASLKKAYENIDEPIAPDDRDALAKSLAAALRHKTLRHRDGDPKHLHLIGLAYLFGVDVEKNTDRALSLITAAADAGLLEAHETLVNVYQKGNGVPVDYEKAIYWQNREVILRRKLYDAAQTPENAFMYLEAIQALNGFYTTLGKFNEVSDTMQLMIREAERMTEEQPAIAQWLTAYTALGYGNLGNAAERLGKLSLALDCHKNALACAETLIKTNPMATPLFALCHERIGNVLKEMGKTDEAMTWYQKSVAIQKIDLSSQTPATSLKALAQTYNNLGDLFVSQGNNEAAAECFYKAFEIRREFAGTYGTKEDKIAFTIDCNDLARMAEEAGELDVAISYYLNSLSVLEDAIDETDSVVNLSHLANTHSYLGDLWMKRGEPTEAERHFQKSFALTERLAKASDAVEMRINLAANCQKLGRVAQARGDLDQALSYYQQALTLTEALAEQLDTPDLLTSLVAYYTDIGTVTEKRGDRESTFAYSMKALAVSETLFARTQTADAAHTLSLAYYNVATEARHAGDFRTALALCRKNLALCEATAEKMPTLDAFDDLAYAQIGFAEVYRDQNMPEQAVLHAEEAYAIWQMLAKQCPLLPEFSEALDEARKLIASLS